MLRVQKIIRHSVCVGMLGCQIIACDWAGQLLLFLYSLCRCRISEFFFLKLWLLSARLYESWSKFPLTSSLLKIKSCPWLWYKVVVPPLTPLCRIGLLLLGKTLDRESTDQYRLVVTASDGNPGGVRRDSLFNHCPSELTNVWHFFNTLSWKRGSNYGTSTSQENNQSIRVPLVHHEFGSVRT